MAQKVCRVGDGDANASIWRLQLPDFFAMGHVSSHLKCFRLSQVHEAILQVKYSIESIKRTTAEKGGLGAKVATDSTYNCFVNTKGRVGDQYFVSSFPHLLFLRAATLKYSCRHLYGTSEPCCQTENECCKGYTTYIPLATANFLTIQVT